MTQPTPEMSPVRQARLAGALGFVVLLCGTFAAFVDARLVVPGDPATTADNILASESIFRLGVVSSLAMYTVFVFYALVLYRVLAPAGRDLARLMVALALVGVPIAMLNQVNRSAALVVLSGADYLSAVPAEQLQAQAMLFLGLHAQGNLVAVVFWGLWLLPLGWLVYGSGYLPRVLGVALMAGCFGWLILFLQRHLLPAYEWLAHARYVAHVAELSFIVWLVVRGVNRERWDRRALESAPV